MKLFLLTLIAATVLTTTVKAQSESRPFRISSLNTAFGVQGEFEGEYVIYSDKIRLRIIKAEISVSHHCPYKGRRHLSAIRFDLATRPGERGWKATNKVHDYLLDRVMTPGEKMTLDEMYFDIPLDPAIDLSKHWLIARIEDTALDLQGFEDRKGYAFAHSACDIFTQGQYEAKARTQPKVVAAMKH